jgi:GT2 family glycosyltransferase
LWKHIDRQEKDVIRVNDLISGNNHELHNQNTDLRSDNEDLIEKLQRFIEVNQSMESENVRLDRLKNDCQRELQQIKTSVGWQILTKYRSFIKKVLPEGSKRRRLYQLSIRAPIVLHKDGFSSFYQKIAARLPFLKKGDKKAIFTLASETRYSWPPISFPEFDQVAVSIIIPVYNQVQQTHDCLKSLNKHTTHPHEIIVVDNASEDQTAHMLAEMKGIRIIHNDENVGFTEACNLGANKARGRHLFFLNNDTVVTSGWLEALLEPFKKENVGAVGAKLIYPDGKLQEAGGIVFTNGDGWNYGRGDDPDLPEYSYLKEVDYCSGAALMIRKDLWDRIGGFDKRYAPAYYEDTDLCFSVRAHGYKVLFQPLAKITHFEGGSAGTDAYRGYKKYQVLNHLKFKKKWHEVLKKDHCEGPDRLFQARERGVAKIVLVVDHHVPEYDKDSGSLRMYRLLRILSGLGHKVIFWPDDTVYDERYTVALQKLGVEVLYGRMDFYDYLRRYGAYIDIIFLSRPNVAIKYIYDAKKYSDAEIFYDTVDLHHLREQRNAALNEGTEKENRIKKTAKQWKDFELFLAGQSDHVLVVSQHEKEVLEKEGFKGKVSVISNVHRRESCETGFSQRSGLMFIGGFVHPPNEDGMVWFVEKIFPIIKSELPDMHLTIVGSNPTQKVKALVSADVTVTGYVKDVRPYFEKSRIFVGPLRYGAGVKGKIGQSMSYGLPVITTHIGAEGMGLTNNENVLIADSEEEFAGKTIAVYNDPILWRKLSDNSRAFIEKNFSFEVMESRLNRLFSGKKRCLK